MSSSPPAGFVDSLRSLGAGLVGSLHDRIALFAVELQEEKLRLVQTILWISATVFIGAMLVMFASLTLVYLLWENARLAALGSLTVLYAVALAAIIVAFRRFLASQPLPFAATLEELGEDRACIQPAN